MMTQIEWYQEKEVAMRGNQQRGAMKGAKSIISTGTYFIYPEKLKDKADQARFELRMSRWKKYP